MQIKTTVRYHLTGQNGHQNVNTVNARENVDQMEPSYTVGGHVNWHIHCGEQYGDSLKN